MIKDEGLYTWMTSFIIQVYNSIDVEGSYTWIDPVFIRYYMDEVVKSVRRLHFLISS